MNGRIDVERLKTALARRPRSSLRLDGFRESAVLVPIVVAPGEPERLLFTVRPRDMSSHAGQIAFPGGKRDPGDADLPATAIREAEEELGLPRARVHVLGLLDDVPTPTGFVITPVVARVDGPVAVAPNVREVAAVFACGLDELGNPACYVNAGERDWMGIRYEMHEYHVNGLVLHATEPAERWRVWGATARILHQLLALVG